MFWERYGEVADAERHVKNIERGEHRIKRHTDIMHAIAAKLDRYNNPWQVCARGPPPPPPPPHTRPPLGEPFWAPYPHLACAACAHVGRRGGGNEGGGGGVQELRLAYGANKGKAYTEEEDRFILCMVRRRPLARRHRSVCHLDFAIPAGCAGAAGRGAGGGRRCTSWATGRGTSSRRRSGSRGASASTGSSSRAPPQVAAGTPRPARHHTPLPPALSVNDRDMTRGVARGAGAFAAVRHSDQAGGEGERGLRVQARQEGRGRSLLQGGRRTCLPRHWRGCPPPPPPPRPGLSRAFPPKRTVHLSGWSGAHANMRALEMGDACLTHVQQYLSWTALAATLGVVQWLHGAGHDSGGGAGGAGSGAARKRKSLGGAAAGPASKKGRSTPVAS